MSDIFHPLVTPLTTYTYTTGSASSDTISATDEERLPPGGFSLQHKFPHWFGRTQRSGLSSARSSREASGTQGGASEYSKTAVREPSLDPNHSPVGLPSSSLSQRSTSQLPRLSGQFERKTSIVDVLHYVKEAFSDESALDTLPLGAAGNAGAWRAWRAYRISKGAVSAGEETKGGEKHSDEWDWNGVWEERVRRGIDTSTSHSVLFGGAGGVGDDIVCFPPVCSE